MGGVGRAVSEVDGLMLGMAGLCIISRGVHVAPPAKHFFAKVTSLDRLYCMKRLTK